MSPILEATNLTKSYGGAVALNQASLALSPGTVHGVIGPNGAGKSTLVKLVGGVIQPDSGVLRIAGEEHGALTPRVAAGLGIASVPQELSVFNDFTVCECVMAGHEATKYGLLSRREMDTKVAAALDSLRVELRLDSKVASLSASEQRLIMLAQAVVRQARIVILDEPTAGLRQSDVEVVISAVRRLAGQGVAVLYVSHRLAEVVDLCDEVTAIRGGRVTAKVQRAEMTVGTLLGMIVDVDHDDLAHIGSEQVDVVHLPEPEVELKSISTGTLRDVSVSFGKGVVTGVCGLNNSGVDELNDILRGTLEPDSGEMTVDGREVRLGSTRERLRARVGYISGERRTVAFVDLPIRENMTVTSLQRWSRYGLLSRRRERAAVSRALMDASIAYNQEQALGTLSGGYQQRVLLLRWLLSDVHVLVLENPTLGVDVAARELLWRAIRSLAAAGKTVIVLSEDLAELVAVCDRVLCMREGVVASELGGGGLTEGALAYGIQ